MKINLAKSILVLALFTMATAVSAAPRKAADDPMALERQEKQQASEAIERNYKSMLRNTDQSVKPVRVDPWQNMRGGDNAKPKR